MNIPPADYLDKLQKEYIVAELRRKIYYSPNDKKYHLKVMGYKKERIEKISAPINLPNIFNDKDVKEEYYKKIYNETGLPNFIYTNEEHEAQFKPQDISNYYLPNNDVKVVKEDGRAFLGRIKTVNLEAEIIEVEGVGIFNKEFGVYPLNKVTRIL